MSKPHGLKPVVRLEASTDRKIPEAQTGDRKGVQSVERAFDILRVVEASPGPVSVAKISQALKSSPSKVHHYLVSLVRRQVLRQTGHGLYDLGPAALGLGLSALSRLDTVDRTSEVARELRDELGEAVFLAVWGNRGPTIIRYFEGLRQLTVEARAGLVLPILTSATGRVFLAWGNPAQVEPLAVAEGGNLATLKVETREQGVGHVDGELLPKIASLSAPVFSYNSDLSLAVTILGWSGEFASAPDGPIARTLRDACASLSREFGGRGI